MEIAKRKGKLINIAFKREIKSDNYRFHDSLKSKKGKKQRNYTKNKAKKIKCGHFQGAIEKSPILLSQYRTNYHFHKIPKIISHFGGNSNIFAKCNF